MKFFATILFLILVSCNTTKPLPPKPPIVTPTEDTINVVDRRINPTFVELDGTKSKIINGDGKGYFTSWRWRQILGKRFPIDSSGYVRAYTKIKSSGKYAYELEGWDNTGNLGKDTFRININ